VFVSDESVVDGPTSEGGGRGGGDSAAPTTTALISKEALNVLLPSSLKNFSGSLGKCPVLNLKR